ncbi:hypothetical protein [Morganella morganii]|jgi:hypothetical protein|uniref:hypothetical protein n=1 Tax=Morganella morganii TaxID=582 RepID=UPI001BD964AC|nr:hypothetical protein [Morganella morganii]MBT0432639.1 hypothetical protein [Morganella morganii subsp. morganii]HEI8419518.1 hypothetical protein [Morganella morganii]
MEFKGTPGPWYTSNEGRLLVRDEEWQCVIADGIGCNGDEEEVANARLIAAAPELLDQLIRLRNKIADYHPDDDDHLDVVDAVINKALGRE